MPETLKEWYEWAQKLDWQYRQEQTESKLLGHSHATHKPHKMTGGGGGHESTGTGNGVGTAVGQRCDTKHAHASDASASAAKL